MIFFCTYTIFYTIVVLAWGGNRDIKRPNSFVDNRPHKGFKAFMKLHLIFHHTTASMSGQEPLKLWTELYSELSPDSGLELVFLLLCYV